MIGVLLCLFAGVRGCMGILDLCVLEAFGSGCCKAGRARVRKGNPALDAGGTVPVPCFEKAEPT